MWWSRILLGIGVGSKRLGFRTLIGLGADQVRDRPMAAASGPEAMRTRMIRGTVALSNPYPESLSAQSAARGVNDNFGVLGYVIIAIFVLSWVGSVVFYNLKGYDELEVNTAEGG